MKKLSLMIACIGIISVAAFGSGFHKKTNPQDGAKQNAQVAPKKDANGKPIEVAKPVQSVQTSPSTAPSRTEPTNDVKPVSPAPAETKRTPTDVKHKATKRMVATDGAERVPSTEKK